MALAETAELVTRLSLDDKLTGPLAKAEAGVAKVGATSAGAATKGMTALERKTTAVGNAFSHASGQAKGFFTGISGFVGAGALLGVGVFLGKAVGEAAAFGTAVSKVQAVTGLAAESASALTDTLNKFGITGDALVATLGRVEKNLTTIAQSKSGTAGFFNDFGLSLTDTNGKLVDANELLLRSADYFNGSATASQKAAALSKIYGRTWTELIPILSKGSDAIREEEASAIHLTDTQISNIAKFREAQRNFQDALGDVQVKIGTELMPLITGALKDVSAWLDTHGDDIAKFFHDAADFAGQAAKAFGMVFDGLKTAWSAVPKPLQDLLVTGLIADKTIKFLFGFDPAAALFKGATGLLTRGGSPLSPLFVTQVGGVPGAPPGGPLPGVAGAAGELAPLGLLATGAVGLTAGALSTIGNQVGTGLTGLLENLLPDANPFKTQITDMLQNYWDNVLPNPGGILRNAQNVIDFFTGKANAAEPGQSPIGETRDMDKIWTLATAATNRLTASMTHPKWLTSLEANWRKMGEVTHAQVELARKDLESGTNIAKAAGFLGHARGAGAGGEVGIRNDLRVLNAALKKTYDPTEIKAITQAIHQLRGRLPTASENHRILQKAEKIATSTEGTKAKIADLKGLLKDVDSKGLRGKLQDIISKVPRSTDNTTRKVTDAGRKIDNTKSAVQSGARTNAAATRNSQIGIMNSVGSMADRIVAAIFAAQPTLNVTAADVTAATKRRNREGPSTGSAGGSNRPDPNAGGSGLR